MRILLALLLATQPLFAQVARTVSGGQTPNLVGLETNYVKNFGAELNINNITQSASITTRTTTTPLFGNASFTIDATSSGQTVKFDTDTYSSGVKGNCLASMWIEGDASLYKVYVEDGSANKLTTDLQLSNYTQATPVQVNYVCTTGAKPVIEATSASAASIEADNVTSGLATNIGNGTITTQWAQYTPTNTQGFGTITAVNLRWRLNAGNLEIQGGFTSGTVTGSTAQLELPPGYTIAGTASARIYVGELIRNGGSRATVMGVQGRTYLTFGAGASSHGDGVGSSLVGSGEVLYFTSVSVPVNVPSTTIISQSSQGWFVAASIAGAGVGLGTANVATYTEITNASLTMTPKSGSAPVGITCSSTNAAATPTTSTSTCAAGSESLGASFNPPDVGFYKVCSSFSARLSTSISAEVGASFQMIETPTNAQTNSQLGGGITTGINTTASSNLNYPFPSVCGIFHFASTATKAVRLMYQQAVTNTAETFIQADGTALLGKRDLFITVEKLSSGQSNPFVIGSVQSSDTSIERMVSVAFGGATTSDNCSSNPCNIYRQNGTTTNNVSSVTRNAEGNYTVNIVAGVFSSAPRCTLSFAARGSSTAMKCEIPISNVLSTSVQVFCFNTTPVVADAQLTVTCHGPK